MVTISWVFGSYGYASEPQKLTQIISNLEAIVQDTPHFSSKWRLLCSQQWAIDTNLNEDRMIRLVRLVALYGINKIENINPSMALAIHARLENETITISCDDPSFPQAVAESDNWLPDNPWGSLTDLKYYWQFKKKKSIKLGRLLSDLRSDYNTTKYTANSIQSIVFHELLHVARMDNLPAELHNSIDEEKSKDVVYACEEYAFRERGVLKAPQACFTCAMADVRGTRTVTNWQDEKRRSLAERFCSHN